MDEEKAPPGWYADPRMAGTQRYWNGDEWTDHRAPVAPTPVIQESMSTWKIAGGVALGLVAVIFLLVVVGRIVTSNDELDCATDNADRAANGQPLRNCD